MDCPRCGILNFVFTTGNVDDREPLTATNLLKGVIGKLVGDKGYIGESLFNKLFFNGIHLVTKVRNNMKERYLTLNDRIILRKRAIIESINDELKNICQIEHSRHRSLDNFIAKIGQTIYFDRNEIGSGADLIDSNKKLDLQMQLRICMNKQHTFCITFNT
jgi:hypothetical protein